MQTGVLPPPEMLRGTQVIHCDENVLRKLPIQNAVNLLSEEWIFVYEKSLYAMADQVVMNFQKASPQLKLTVKDPYFIEFTNEKNMPQTLAELEEELHMYMVGQ